MYSKIVQSFFKLGEKYDEREKNRREKIRKQRKKWKKAGKVEKKRGRIMTRSYT